MFSELNKFRITLQYLWAKQWIPGLIKWIYDTETNEKLEN